MWINKSLVHQVGDQTKVILRCTVNQSSRFETRSLYENQFMWKCNILSPLVLSPLGFVTNNTKQEAWSLYEKPVYVEVQHFIVFSIRPFGICYEYYKTVLSLSQSLPIFSFWLKFLSFFLQSCQSWTCQDLSSVSSVLFRKLFFPYVKHFSSKYLTLLT